ncbi:MAG TPA: short-chain dehydrogenase [Cytophagales bacterium]|nr:short-chain dehydrogenase [Cytophagales bacterium]HAA18056.1 short-chain dehydrogenase [Cytophagales bacterium]HAP62395.1 short-chain dehydrogenase [Cytophagales bacterium]
MANWTKNNIPDLTGKIILVTGGNSGLGYEAVKMFAEKNAKVILASRSIERGKIAKQEILQDVPAGDIDVRGLDLGSLNSIKGFAAEFKRNYAQLDILMNNAGIMWCPYGKTKDGFESQMGVNHFGHFALTGLLLDLIVNTEDSRVVNVSSLGHRRAKWDPEALMFDENNYDGSVAYFNSKLANLLFTYELQRKFEAKGIRAMAVAAHPGGSNTNLAKHVEERFWFRLLKPLFLILAQSAAKGTLPQVRASVDPQVKGSEYYGPKGMNEMGGYPVVVKSTEDSHNRDYAAKLWQASEKLTGVSYPI